MPSDSITIRRCQHIKVNGTQCGSPAVREHNYCYFHMRWHRKGMQVNAYFKEQQILVLPTLEDANSIQVGLAEVMRQMVTQMIDHKTAALLLYALQIASANVKRTSFEPELLSGAPGVPARPEECQPQPDVPALLRSNESEGTVSG